jgi:ornithine cyclodeaminase/alanine dehydrogenase-like protein (mu-crystallin family)
MNDAGAPRFIDAAAVAAALPWRTLVDALEQAFVAGDTHAPQRLHYALDAVDGTTPTLLVMPAWSAQRGVGTKLVSIFPGNTRRGLPSLQGLYLLMDPVDGRLRALIDAGELTARRTAAASALASRRLSRPDSRCLVMAGTGRLARHLPLAHAATRPIERVLVWGRAAENVQRLVNELRTQGLDAAPAASLPDAVAVADIVSCATLSHEPLLRGQWLRPGTHVDLVGAFTPSMRETDDAVFARADAVWCDTREGALAEAGDLVQAIAAGAFDASRLAGDFAALCRGGGRRDTTHITVFKSVGMALEDLVAARLVVDHHDQEP